MVQLNAAQAFDVSKANQGSRDLLSPLHVGEQVRASRKHHGTWALAVENASGLFHRTGRAEFEKRQSHHDFNTGSFSMRCFGRRGGSFVACPSPPSQGGGTRSASAQGTFGNCAGPYRGARPAFFSARAFRIFSGVMGTSSIRTPTAS